VVGGRRWKKKMLIKALVGGYYRVEELLVESAARGIEDAGEE
jgi:hypothetical protein